MEIQRRGSAVWVVLAVIVAILLIGGFWYYWTHSQGQVQSQTVQGSQTAATQVSYQSVSWKDPKGSVAGFHLNIPASWTALPYGNEYFFEADSCPRGALGCNANTAIQLRVQINPANGGLPLRIPDYTQQGETVVSSSTVTVGGVQGSAVVGEFNGTSGLNGTSHSSVVAFALIEKDGTQYLGWITGPKGLEAETQPVVQEMLSSFTFDPAK